jgi:hypothetical protein
MGVPDNQNDYQKSSMIEQPWLACDEKSDGGL